VLAKTQVVAAPLPLTLDPPARPTAPAAPTTGSRSRTQPMRHSQLSNEQILLALSESYNIIAAVTKYQVKIDRGSFLLSLTPATHSA
jgi:hypothetical protein